MIQRLKNLFVSITEGPVWFECSCGFLCAASALLFCLRGDIEVNDHTAVFESMIAISIGMAAVSAIVVNLSSALSHGAIQSQLKIEKIADASFAALLSLSASVGVGLLLLGLDLVIAREIRYLATGGWVGLVFGACTRTLVLGRRILVVRLRNQTRQTRADK